MKLEIRSMLPVLPDLLKGVFELVKEWLALGISCTEAGLLQLINQSHHIHIMCIALCV